MKVYSTSPKAPELEPHHQIQFSVILKKLIERVLPLLRDAVSIFYSPSQVDCIICECVYVFSLIIYICVSRRVS